MAAALWVVSLVAQLYLLCLLARLVLDMVMMLSQTWRPRGRGAAAAEVLYTITDPPLKLARRIIPPLRLGMMSLDLGYAVVFLAVSFIASYLPTLAMRWG